jgi:ABC-type transport system involved in multi-copper enzyme maturation permease subunit
VLNLISVELLKIRTRTVTWVSFGIVVAFLAFMIIGVRLIIKGAEGPGSEEFMQTNSALRFPLGFGALPNLEVQFGLWAVLVLVSLLVGSEYSWGTLRLVLARGPSRTQFMLAKLVAVMIAITIGTVAILIVAAVLMPVGDLAVGVFDPVYPDGFLPDLILDWLRTAGVLMIYLAVAFAAAGLLRSAGAGLAVGVGFIVLEQIVGHVFSGFGGMLATIGSYFPSAIVRSVLNANRLSSGMFGGESPGTTLGPWTAGGLIALYFIVLTGATIWVFNRRDITSGEAS